jgi:hypothetical protein
LLYYLTYAQGSLKNNKKRDKRGKQTGRRQANIIPTAQSLTLVNNSGPTAINHTTLQPESHAARTVFNTVSRENTLVYK